MKCVINGSIRKIFKHSGDSGFAILQIEPSDKKSAKILKDATNKGFVTVIGYLHDAAIGACITCSGEIVQDEKYGHQIRASFILNQKMSVNRNSKAMLESSLFPSISKEFANDLDVAFGEDVFKVFEIQPHRLSEDKSLNYKNCIAALQDWRLAKASYPVFNYLKNIGFSTLASDRIVQSIGNKALKYVSNNPYSLMGISGLGFKTIDPIALGMGVSATSELRVSSAISSIFTAELNKGSSRVDLESLVSSVSDNLKIPNEESKQLIRDGVRSGSLVYNKGKDGLFYISEFSIYKKEMDIAKRINSISETPLGRNIKPIGDLDAMYSDAQKESIVSSIYSKISIITGGPGVGKTTVIKGLLDILRKIEPEYKTVVLTPTGKSASRIKEVTGIEAFTAHSLLKYSEKDGFSKSGGGSISDYSTFIFDEGSMFDIFTFGALLNAIPDKSRIIIAGDVDQLKSVDPGNVLQDIIDSKAVKVSRLTEIKRRGESEINIAASAVNNGILPNLNTRNSDFVWIDSNSDQDICRIVCELMAKTIPDKYGISAENIQVLSPQKSTPCGVDKLNESLKPAINKYVGASRALTFFGEKFHIGDRVMQTKNNKDIGISNGEIGVIHAIDFENREANVVFDGASKTIPFSAFSELKVAFATTVHKSQGAEFEAIIMPISNSHKKMLSRDIIYTGITRGKKMVFLVGSRGAMQLAMENKSMSSRQTNLKSCLEEVMGDRIEMNIAIENRKLANERVTELTHEP